MNDSKKKLVAYFSCSGVTKDVAEVICEITEADIFKIEPQIPYSKADLDWRDSQSRSSKEMNDPTSRPAIASKVTNMEEYNVVFIGFPIWWYIAPSIINTFLESYNLSGKTIVPFATSGSSEFGKTKEVLLKLCPDTVLWREGKRFCGRVSNEELFLWLGELNL